MKSCTYGIEKITLYNIILASYKDDINDTEIKQFFFSLL